MPKHDASVTDPPADRLKELADAGDLVGVLDFMRSHRDLPREAMTRLARAVQQLAARDVGQLTEAAFGEILAFATSLLLRCVLHAEFRMREFDAHSDRAPDIPRELVAEGWIDRAERLSNFIAAMTTARTRARHVEQLNAEREKKAAKAQMADTDDEPAPRGNVPGRNGRGSRSVAADRLL